MKEKKKILIIDDSLIDRRILCRFLSGEYEVVQAQEGAQGLKELQKAGGEISAVLLDLFMPGMDGYEFLTQLRADARFAALPVMVMTQDDREEAQLRALELGATDFLSKPYRPAILRQRLSNLVGLYEALIQRTQLERDDLTGLYSRVAFLRRVAQLRAEEPGKSYQMAVVDIDRFKLVNEIFGPEAGDEILRVIARLIRDETEKKQALCSRFFGDDFVIFGRFEHDWAQGFIQRLQQGLSAQHMLLSVTLRMGVYTTESKDEPLAAVMYDRARIALLSIKGRYDCFWAQYTEQESRRLLETQEIEGDMQGALSRGEFEIYFQPKYDLTTGRVYGAEALVRWNHPVRGCLGPDTFIPLFEKNGFIHLLDKWLWRQVCRWHEARRQAGGRAVPVSVNVSRVDLYDPKLPELLQGLLKEYEISPQLLELEITETAYTENAAQLIRLVKKLKEFGFVVQMDDFGSGYSSLNMLAEVPVDALKLDMRFLQNSSPDSRNVLNFVIALAKWMNLSVVAEGIETREQAAFLCSMGCKHGQGYYFSKPLRVKDFEQLLNCDVIQDVGADASFLTEEFEISEIWNPLSQFNLLFNAYVGALAIFEYTPGRLFLVRGNENFYQLFIGREEAKHLERINELDNICKEDLAQTQQTLNNLLDTENMHTGDLRLKNEQGDLIWLHTSGRVIYRERDRILLLLSLENCTHAKLLSQQLERQRAFFARTYDTVPCGIAQFERVEGYRFLSANADMLAMLGISRAAFESREYLLTEFVDEVGKKRIKEGMSLFQDNYDEYHLSHMEYQLHSTDGRTIWVNDITQLLPDENGNIICQAVYTDITEKKKKEKELRLIEQQFLMAVGHASNQVFTYFPESRKLQVFDAHEGGNLTLRTVENGFEEYVKQEYLALESKKEMKRFLQEIDSGAMEGRVEINARTYSGREGWFEGRFYRQPAEQGVPAEVVCVFTDISLLKQKELGLSWEAHRDPLTKLYNRARFTELVQRALELPDMPVFAFVMVDLDNFKAINDTRGHAFGDEVLCMTAAALHRILRSNDVIARLGGDEFALILSGVKNSTTALQRMESVRASIREEGAKRGVEINSSLGAALAPEHGKSFAEIYQKADKALYASKKNGKSRCCVFDPAGMMPPQ